MVHLNCEFKFNVVVSISSRNEADIRLELAPDPKGYPGISLLHCSISASDVREDIAMYSQSLVDRRLPNKAQTLRRRLANQLAVRCNGMFLWTRLQSEHLRGSKNGTQLERIIEHAPGSLYDQYCRMWTTIQARPIEDQERALAILR